MRRMCRHLHKSTRRRALVSTLLGQVHVVTDPGKLAQLYAEAERRKKSAELERTLAEAISLPAIRPAQ